LSNDQHICPGLAKRFEKVMHLHEVRQTGDSAQMTEEYEQERAGKFRQPDGCAIGAQKSQLSCMATNV
jgi:hypothetical protein